MLGEGKRHKNSLMQSKVFVVCHVTYTKIKGKQDLTSGALNFGFQMLPVY